MRYSISTLAFVIIASCTERRAPAPTTSSIATVVSLSGDVRIRRAGTTAWTPANSVTAIHADDMIQTLDAGSVVLRVTETGGELAMSPKTTMRFDESPRPHAVHGTLVAKTTPDPTRSTKVEVATHRVSSCCRLPSVARRPRRRSRSTDPRPRSSFSPATARCRSPIERSLSKSGSR